MSTTISGTVSTGVTLTTQTTTITTTGLLTSGPGVSISLYGTLNESGGLTLHNFGSVIGSSNEAINLGNGYGDNADPAEIYNNGLIDGSGGYGLLIYGPAFVDDAAGGTIEGAVYGIGMNGDPSTVINGGLLEAGDIADIQIALNGAGHLSFINLTGGTVIGGAYGVYLENAEFESVSNQAGATIIGEVVLDKGGTVLNAGSISGVSGGNALSFGSSSATRLIVDPGAAFTGAVASGSSGSNTVEFAQGSGATGTLGGFGTTITNFNTMVLDAGAKWTVSGNNAGLDKPVITGFTLGDTFDLTDLAATSESFANNALILTGGTATTTLKIQGSFVSGNFLVSSFGTAGSSIQLLPLALANAQAGQTVLDSATIHPFSSVSVLDLNSGAPAETLMITLSNAGSVTNADGFLSGAGLSTISNGVYRLNASSPTAATTELDALVFTPTAHQVTPGSSVITAFAIRATDTAGSSRIDTNTSVIATAANDPPTITGTSAGRSTTDEATIRPLSGVTLADVDVGVSENLTLTLTAGGMASDADGTLFGTGLTEIGTGVYTLTGTPSLVTSELDALVFTPTAHQVTPGSTVTTGLTLSDSQIAGGSTTTATDATTTVIATAVNDAPTIAGTSAGQGTTDEASLTPLSGVTLADVDFGVSENLTLTLTAGGVASDANGTLSGNGLTKTGAGIYALTGTPSLVTSQLDALVFTPTMHQVAPGGTVTSGITLSDSQIAGGSTTTATDTTTRIIATAVNDAPTIAGTSAGQGTTDEATIRPLSGVTLADVDFGVSENLSVTLTAAGVASDADGTLSGNGLTKTGTGLYLLTGTPSLVTSELQALVFTPTAHQVTPGSTVTTGITLSDSQIAGGTTASATDTTTSIIVTAVNDAPVITGTRAGQTTTDEATITPLSGVTLADIDFGVTENLTLNLTAGGVASDANGALSGAGLTHVGTGVYTLTGTPSLVTSELDALVFTPIAHQVTPGSTVTTGITLSDSQIAGGTTASATDTTTSVIATAVNDAPTITGTSAGQGTTDEATIRPLSGVTLADVDVGVSENLTLTVTAGGVASDADGLLSGNGLTKTGAGVYMLTGAPSLVTSELNALVFTPTAHQGTPGSTVTTSITLSDSQTAGGSTTSATDTTTSIIATAVNDAPVITGTSAGQGTTDEATIRPLSGVTLADVDVGVSENLTLTVTAAGVASDADGTLSGTGLVHAGAGIYTLTGAPSLVTTQLDALVFTPTMHQVAPGSTVTSGITLSDSQVAGGSTTTATDTTTSIIATAVNDAPTITGTSAGQGTTDEVAIRPLSGVTLADVDFGVSENLTLTLSAAGVASDADGTLSGSGLTKTGTGLYLLTGTPGLVTSELNALVFTPTAHQVAPGSTVTTGITLSDSQIAGGSTTTATDTTSSVIVTAVNDAPTITGTSAGQGTTDEATIRPLSGVTLADVDFSVSENLALTVTAGGVASDANGTLSGNGLTKTGAGIYALTGTPSLVTSELDALVFTPTAHQVTPGGTVTTGITLSDSQIAGGSTTTATDTTTSIIATAVNDAPVITGTSAGQGTTDEATIRPFSGVTLADVDVGVSENLSLMMTADGVASDANGTLSGNGLTKTGTGTYALTGTPSLVTSELDALVFTPTAHQVTPGGTVTTGITLSDSQIAGGTTTSATDATTSIIATAVNDVPTIAGTNAGQSTTDEASLTPLSGVTLADVDFGVSENLTLTVTVGGVASDANGMLSGNGLTKTGAGIYALTGAPSLVTSELDALIFTPTAHQVAPGGTVATGITLSDSQIAGGSTTTASDTTTSIIATAVNDAPVITGTSAGQGTTDEATIRPLSGVTLADVDVGVSETLSLMMTADGVASDANGTLSGNGLTKTGTGTYALTGTPSLVTSELDALVFTPTAHQVTPGGTVTTGITLSDSQIAGGTTTSATDATTSIIATAVNDAPTIAGTNAGQSTTDEAAIRPFSGATIADVDVGVSENLTLTLTAGGVASDANGTLSGNGLTRTGTGIYALTGAPSLVTSELDALVFTPTMHQVVPGGTVATGITLSDSQIAGGSTTTASDTTTSIIATAVNDAPTITGTSAGQGTTDEATIRPFSGVILADIDVGVSENLTLTLTANGVASDANGTLNGAGLIHVGNGTYTLAGAPSLVTAELDALVFTPTMHQVAPGSTVTSGITLSDSQIAGGSTTTVTDTTTSIIATAVNDAPVISGTSAGQGTTDEATIRPFSGVTLGDVDVGVSENLSLMMTAGTMSAGDADGTLSGNGLTKTGTGAYALSGTPSLVTSELDALVFTPTAHQVTPGGTVTTGITLSDSQIAGGSTTTATDATTTVIATAVNDAPVITGTSAGQTTTDGAAIRPFSGVTLADVDFNVGENLIITLAAGDADGSLAGNGLTRTGTGIYTLAGTPSLVTAELQALVFTPTAHQVAPGGTVTTGITLSDSQIAGGSTTTATDVTTSVIATAANDVPVITGTSAGQTIANDGTIAPFASVSIIDPAFGAMETLTLTLSDNGTLTGADGTLSGFGLTSTGVGTYSLSAGTPAAVSSALQGVYFVSTLSPDVTAATTLTIADSDNHATSTSNGTTTINATDAAAAPVIAGALGGQTVMDSFTIAAFSGVTITDPNGIGQLDTVTVTSNSTLDGTLSDAVGGSVSAAGSYTVTGSASAVSSALRGLVFTPTQHQVAPGNTVATGFTIGVVDTAGQGASNAATSVIATAANDTPTIGFARAGQTIANDGTIAPFASVAVTDPAYAALESLTITLTDGGTATDADGTLSGAGLVHVGTGAYTLAAGTPGAVTAALQGIGFVSTLPPDSAATTVLTIIDSDNHATAASNDITTINASNAAVAPVIAGVPAGQTIADTGTIAAFAGVTITDANGVGQLETVTVTSSNTSDGVLSDAAGGAVGASGVYTVIGSAASVSSALHGLVFTPTLHQVAPGSSVATGLTIGVIDTAGQSAGNAATSVIVTASNDTPTISGAVGGQTVANDGTITPFASVAIADPAFGALETLTITLADGGIATDADGTLSGNLVHAGSGLYTLAAGTPAAVTTALQGISFVSTLPFDSARTTVLTIADSDNHATSASSDASFINGSNGAVAPVISGAVAGQAIADTGSIAAFAGVTITDPNGSGQLETLTVASNAAIDGVLSDTVGGAISAAGVYSVSGAAMSVSTALQGLVFTPTQHQVAPGNTVATGFSISVVDSAGLSASDTTTSLITTAANDTPTLLGGLGGQTVAGNGTIAPFASVSLADPAFGAMETITITLTDGGVATDADGTLSGAGLVHSGAGTYILASSTPGAVTTALNGINFVSTLPPNSTATTVLSIADSDNHATATSNGTTTINASSAPAAPVIAGAVANQAVGDSGTIAALSGVTIADPNGIAQLETVTVTSSAASDGTFSDSAGGTAGAAGVYTVIGSAASVSSALHGLLFTPTRHQVAPGSTVATGFTISVIDTAGQSASDTASSVIATAANTPPAIGGITALRAIDQFPVVLLPNTTVSDPDIGQTETATVTLSAPNGVLSDTAGTVGGGGRSYVVTGSAGAVTAALDALSFTPAKGAVQAGATLVTGVTLTVGDGVAATNVATSVAVVGAETPFADFNVFSGDPTAEVSVSLAVIGQQGVFSNLGVGTLDANGTYTVSGTEAVVDAALQGVVFIPDTPTSDSTPEVQEAATGGIVFETDAAANLVAGAATSVVGGSGSVTTSGGSGLFVGGTAGQNLLIATNPAATLLGGNSGDRLVASASGGDVLVNGLGSETLDGSAASEGDLFFGSAAASSSSLILGGAGQDTIATLGGSNTVSSGSAGSLIFLGAGRNLVQSHGADTIFSSTGSDTIAAGNSGVLDFTASSSTLFFGSAATNTVIAGAGSLSVLGGAGRVEAFGGAGAALLFGGTAGGNTLVGGAGAVTMVGGGGGDLLDVANAATDLLVAGAGNETLNAGGASGQVGVFAGSGLDQVALGSGLGIYVGGSGAASVFAGSGTAVFEFVNGSAGSSTIAGFTAGSDFIHLQGYAAGAAAGAVQAARFAGGNTVLGLSDGTRITLVGVSSLGGGSFI